MKHTVTELKLRNGAQGLLVHIPDATVMTTEINFRAGEYLVDSKKWEVPHLMEHVLLGANQTFPKARDFQAELEKNGAYSNASTGVYDITYESECADLEWERVLRLMLVAITKPLFLRDEFKSEYGNVWEELSGRMNNHFLQLSLALREKYGFYAKMDKERLRLMKNSKLADVKEHYARTHKTANMRFVIAGNITPGRFDDIQAILSDIDLPKGRRFVLPNERPRALEQPLYIHNQSVKNMYFYVDTYLNRRLNDIESETLSLVNTLLTETLHSKILGTARERGLVYDMSSSWNESKLSTGWWFGAQVSPKNIDALFDIIVQEIQKIYRGELKTDDIEAAKLYALGRFQRGAQTVGGTASGYSNRYFFDEVIDYSEEIPRRIKDIKKQDIIDIVTGLFTGNVWGLGVLGRCGTDKVNELQDRIAPLWQI